MEWNKFKKLYSPGATGIGDKDDEVGELLDPVFPKDEGNATESLSKNYTDNVDAEKTFEPTTILEKAFAKMAGDNIEVGIPRNALEYQVKRAAENGGDSKVVENAKANGGIGWKEPGTVLYEDHDRHYAGENITITQPFLELANGQEYTLTVTINDRVTTVTSAVSAERDERTGDFLCYAISLIGVASYNLDDNMIIRYYLSGYNSISLPYPPGGMDVMVKHIKIATSDTVYKISAEMVDITSPVVVNFTPGEETDTFICNRTFDEIGTLTESGYPVMGITNNDGDTQIYIYTGNMESQFVSTIVGSEKLRVLSLVHEEDYSNGTSLWSVEARYIDYAPGK